MDYSILDKLYLTKEDLEQRNIWLLGVGKKENITTMMNSSCFFIDKTSGATIGKKDYKEEMLEIKEGDLVIFKVATTNTFNTSCMLFYAVGVVERNLNDGSKLEVYLHRFKNKNKDGDAPLCWYYSTYFPLVTKLDYHKNQVHEDLINFAFLGEEQDIRKYKMYNENAKRQRTNVMNIYGRRNKNCEKFLNSVSFSNL